MSTVNIRRLNLLSNGSVNIQGSDANTIAITTNNVVVANTFRAATGSVSTTDKFYDSSNTSFYFDPAGNTVLNHQKVGSFGMSLTRMASDSGLSAIAIWSGNRPFNACSIASSWAPYPGRGISTVSGTTGKGLDRLTHLNIPSETTEPIDYGMYYFFSFALFANGNLYTWGSNSHGQCGLGNTTAYSVPTLAATDVVAVYHHPTLNGYDAASKLIIKKTDGYLYGTGYNANGQLGVGDTTNRTTFTLIPNSYGAISIWSVGGGTGALIIQTSDYRILACGYNANGQLGNGNTSNQNYLVDVTTNWGGLVNSGRRLVKVICGLGFVDTGYDTRCWLGMLLDDGTTTYFRLAGNNSWGSIGNGTTGNTNYSTPQVITMGGRIRDVSGFGGGPGTIMCLLESGSLYNWGYGGFGQLGRGSAVDSGVISLVTTGVDKIFCDGHDTSSYNYRKAAFYRKNGLLYGTGYNEHGELGQGNTTTPITSWTLIRLPQDFVCDSIGTYQTTSAGTGYLFFGTDGRMFMTGYNAHNMLTWDTTANVLSPIEIRPALGG